MLLLEKDTKKSFRKLRMTWSRRVIRIPDQLNLHARKHTRKSLETRHESVIGADESSHGDLNATHFLFSQYAERAQQAARALASSLSLSQNTSDCEKLKIVIDAKKQ